MFSRHSNRPFHHQVWNLHWIQVFLAVALCLHLKKDGTNIEVGASITAAVPVEQREHLEEYALTPPPPLSIEGVDLPSSVSHLVDGHVLYRNGHGVRSVSFYGLGVKVYVAGLYSKTPLRSEDDVWNCDTPLQFDFTFLRSVGQGRVTQAWQTQLEHSVTHNMYDGYEHDRDLFIGMFGPIAYKGTETVQLIGDDTWILDQGEVKGSIAGKDFQTAFLSMWFGERAVAVDLKDGLLGTSHGHVYDHVVA